MCNFIILININKDNKRGKTTIIHSKDSKYH